MKSKKNIALSAKSLRNLQDDPAYQRKIRRHEKINSFIMSPAYITFLVLFTLYSLYSDDFRLACGSISNDIGFNIFTIVTMIFFLFDIIVSGYYKPQCWKYAGFYIDILALLSLVLDLTWVWNMTAFDKFNADSNIIPAITAALRASDQQQKFIWYMRFVRYIRFMFLINFFQSIIDKSDYKEDQLLILKRKTGSINLPSQILKDSVGDPIFTKKNFLTYPTFDFDWELRKEIEGRHDKEENLIPEVHNTSRNFTYTNIKKAMYLNIWVMILIPVFINITFSSYQTSTQSTVSLAEYLLKNNKTNGTTPNGLYIGLLNLQIGSRNPPISLTRYNLTSANPSANSTFIQYWVFNRSLNPIFFNYVNSVYGGTAEIDYLRSKRLCESIIATHPVDLTQVPLNGSFTIGISDNRNLIMVDAIIGIVKTTLLIVFFLGTIYLYYNDSKKLLLNPFAEMMDKIQKIEQNPMNAAKEMQAEIDEQEKKALFDSTLRRELSELKKYETNILTNTLAKSGQLLALGFGEAGINIILEKLNKGSEMVGRKVICLFGFADIKYFTEVSDKLKEDVMTFVNEIAEIVSPLIDKYTGSTNKNLGEAFLFVWKFREQDTITMFDYDQDGNLHKNIKLKEYSDKNNPITDRCDLALLSFLECILYVYQSATLSKYRTDKRLADLPNFRVKNSFGLHIGWGIEGAIGSEHKIDASYLSPNVNLASRVQYATKQFGVHILISGMVYDLISKEIQALMREVDCVELKGSKLAMHLWTYDMDLSILEQHTDPKLDDNKQKKYDMIKKERMSEYQKEIKYFHQQFYEGKISGKTMFLSKKSVIDVHRKFTKSFYDKWNKGFDLYISGKWEESKPYFEETLDMIDGYHDKPSEVILGFLKEANYKAPSYWKGVRHLTNK